MPMTKKYNYSNLEKTADSSCNGPVRKHLVFLTRGRAGLLVSTYLHFNRGKYIIISIDASPDC